jgi:hypothetical protein
VGFFASEIILLSPDGFNKDRRSTIGKEKDARFTCLHFIIVVPPTWVDIMKVVEVLGLY